MPWKECHVMDERLRFVARLLEGEKMAPLCAEFGISRKTGYKIYDRYKDCGVRGVHGSQPAAAPPSESTAGADRGDDCAAEARVSRLGRAEDPREAAAAVHRRRTSRPSARSTPCSTGTAWCTDAAAGAAGRPAPRCHGRTEPNALWCADYKGEFMLGNRQYCYPLTITDFASRYLLTCEALATTQETIRLHRLRAHVQGIRAAARHPDRQRRAVCLSACALRTQQIVGLVAPAGDSDRAHQTRASATKRPARADASDAEEGGDQAGRRERPAAAGALRCLRRSLQPGAAAPGARDESPGRPLRALRARRIAASRT